MSPTHLLRQPQLRRLIVSDPIQFNPLPLPTIRYRPHSSIASARSSPQTDPVKTNHEPNTSTPTKARPHTIDPRWLTITKRRIGKCLMFGLKPAQVDEAGKVLQRLARDWREFAAASEGFLTHATRRALFRRGVVWGDMVSFFSDREKVACRLKHHHLLCWDRILW